MSPSVTSFAFLSLFLALGCSTPPEALRWEFTGGPSGQDISSVTIDGRGRSRVLAGLTSGGVYTSSNEGATWTKRSTVRPNTAINNLTRHPLNATNVFALTDSGLFVSKDDGTFWLDITVDGRWPRMTFHSLAIDPYNTGMMYAGTSGHGIYKTTDGGNTWRQSNGGLDSVSLAASDVRDIEIDPSRPDNLYSAIQGLGIVQSGDGGETWTRLAAILGSGGIAPTSILIHPRSPGIVCFGIEGGTIYRTVDEGRTWSPAHLGSGDPHPVHLVADQGQAGNIYAGTGNDLLFSTNFGLTWKSIAGGLPRVPVSIAVSPGPLYPELLAYGEGLGLMRSTDNGDSWLSAESPPGGSVVSAMAGDERGGVVYATVGGSVHRWSSVTKRWISASNNLMGGPITSIALGTDSAAIAQAATPTGIFSTRNSGTDWTTDPRQLQGQRINLISTHPIFVTRVLANAGEGLFVSTDKGVTWAQTKPLTARYHVRLFTYSPNDAGLVFGATGGIIISSNGGLSWNESSYGLTSDDIVEMTLDDRDRETVYAWTGQGDGFRSTNKGLVWNHYSPPWRLGEPVHIVFDRYKPSEVVALAGSDHLYYSLSGGGTWFTIPAGPVPGPVTSAYWNSQTSSLYLGIKQEGVYRLMLGEYLKRLFESRD